MGLFRKNNREVTRKVRDKPYAEVRGVMGARGIMRTWEVVIKDEVRGPVWNNYVVWGSERRYLTRGGAEKWTKFWLNKYTNDVKHQNKKLIIE